VSPIGQILEETDIVLVHYKQMTISRTGLMDVNGDTIPLIAAFPYDRNEYWVVQSEQVQCFKTNCSSNFVNLLYEYSYEYLF